MTLVPPQNRPATDTILGNHEGRARALERRPPGRWIYVGTYPGDPGTTSDSPPFENSYAGWARFRITTEYGLEIESELTDGYIGMTVFTVPAGYLPPVDNDRPAVVDGVFGVSRVLTTGEVILNP